jgi:hypothetical protein
MRKPSSAHAAMATRKMSRTPPRLRWASRPSVYAVAYPTYTPTIITSPCAKLMSLSTPYTIV